MHAHTPGEWIHCFVVCIYHLGIHTSDHSHWMHLYAGLLRHCQDSIVDESRGSEAKSQQRTSDGWDSLMLQRLIEMVFNQTQSNSNWNNPIVESQMVRQILMDCQGSICVWLLVSFKQQGGAGSAKKTFRAPTDIRLQWDCTQLLHVCVNFHLHIHN